MSQPKFAVITPSYHNDHELVVDLCASLDQYLQAEFEHLIIVPRADLALFGHLAGPRRRILAEEDLLRPYGFHKIPFFKRIRIPGLIDKKIREQWFRLGAGRLNGWVIQQLLKISAPQLTQAQLIMFADSDNVLFRPLTLAQLYTDDKIQLSRKEMVGDMSAHRQWRANALQLLGVQPAGGPDYNYIGNLIVWDRDTVLAMQRRIEEVSGVQWQVALARKKAISEYILYGVFCEQVAPDHGGHSFAEQKLTCSFWTTKADLTVAEMAKSLAPAHVALHIQSTIPMPIEQRRKLIGQLAGLAPVSA